MRLDTYISIILNKENTVERDEAMRRIKIVQSGKRYCISLLIAAAMVLGYVQGTMVQTSAAEETASFKCDFYQEYQTEAEQNLYFTGILPGRITAKASVYSQSGGTYQLTAGMYHQGRLVAIVPYAANVIAGGETEKLFAFTIPVEDYRSYEIKVFAWNSWKEMRPFSSACVLNAETGSRWSNSFFDGVKLSTLQTDVQLGEMKNIYDLLKQQADNAMKLTSFSISSNIAGRALQIYAFSTLLNGYISQDETYIKKGIWFLTNAAENSTVETAIEQNDALCVGDTLMAYAIGYEWAKPFLSIRQEQLLRAEIEEYGAWLFENSSSSPWGENTPARKAWNWNAVAHGSLGLAALAVGGHDDWLALAKTRCTGYLTNALDITGYAREGASYISHGLHFVLAFAQACQARTGQDIFQDAVDAAVNDPEKQTADPRNLIEYLLYLSKPGSGQMTKINQSDGFGPGDGLLYIIMKTRSAEGLWAWLKMSGSEGDGSYGQGSWLGTGSALPFVLLCYDNSLQPKAPDETWEPVKRFSTGGLAAKTGWGEKDALLTVNAGGRRSSIWNHADAGSITFSALGETFITDLGPGKVASRFHSIIQIDGKGQSKLNADGTDASGIQSTPYSSDVESYYSNENSVYYGVDLHRAYERAHGTGKVETIRRQVFYRTGSQPYAVLVDRVQKDAASHTYTSRLILEDSTAAVRSADGTSVTLTGGNTGAKCLVQFLAPSTGNLSVKNSPVQGTTQTYQHIDFDVENSVETVIITVLCPYSAAEPAPQASINAAEDTLTITRGTASEQLSLSSSIIELKK